MAASMTAQALLTPTRDPATEHASNGTQAVALAGGHSLRLERNGSTDVLLLESRGGGLALMITVSPAGATIHLSGADLSVRSTGELALEAEKIAIRSRGPMVLESERDIAITSEGNLRTEARSQDISARNGDVVVYANDDVRLDGERIRMNC